jgi:hypothetical protein
MYTSRYQTTVPASPSEVLALLTEPEAIARWSPIPFELLQLDGERLRAGSHARVAGCLAGRSVEFDVDVLDASDQRLELVADGAISLGVQYVMRPAPAGSEVQARAGVSPAKRRGKRAPTPPRPELAGSQQAVASRRGSAESAAHTDEPLRGVAARLCFIAAGPPGSVLPLSRWDAQKQKRPMLRRGVSVNPREPFGRGKRVG